MSFDTWKWTFENQDNFSLGIHSALRAVVKTGLALCLANLLSQNSVNTIGLCWGRIKKAM